MEQTKAEWQGLFKKGVDIIVIDTPILNTRNKSDLEKKLIDNIVFELLTYMVEKDRERIRKTRAEGIAIAKAKGIHLRRTKINYESLSNDKKKKIKSYYPLWESKNITALEFMNTIELK